MCFPSMKKPRPTPAPPNKLDTANDALRAMQGRRQGGTTLASTDLTAGGAGRINTAAPIAGGKTILGG